jgi:hypothetical protein
MKRLSLLICCACLLAAIANAQNAPVAKTDLQKIKWIEGSWKGMYNNQPFYEHYRFANDSTIEITSFEWNGKDSSKSSVSLLQWIDGHYYLGNKKNWKATEISDAHIYMLPAGRGNDILWKFISKDHWQAILKTKDRTNTYDMIRFDLK